MNEKLCSLSVIAKERGILKSQLHYYVKIGLIFPAQTFGNTFIFDKENINTQLDIIEEAKKKGLGLKQIKELIVNG